MSLYDDEPEVMGTCGICGEQIASPDLLGHLRGAHDVEVEAEDLANAPVIDMTGDPLPPEPPPADD